MDPGHQILPAGHKLEEGIAGEGILGLGEDIVVDHRRSTVGLTS